MTILMMRVALAVKKSRYLDDENSVRLTGGKRVTEISLVLSLYFV